MNRSLIVATLVLGVILVVGVIVLVGIKLYMNHASQNPSTQDQNSTTSTYPSLGGSQSNVTSIATSKSAVGAAFEAQDQIPASEHVQVSNANIVGNYAIQNWSSDNMGGEALLKYDATSNKWNVVTDNGGTWSVAGLAEYAGITTDTAAALLKDMSQYQ